MLYIFHKKKRKRERQRFNNDYIKGLSMTKIDISGTFGR